jgi:ABC-2 type transport system permease protein
VEVELKKMLLVLRNEIVTMVTRPSFLLVTIGVPLIGFLILAGVSALRDDSSADPEDPNGPVESQEMEVEGYVDLSGLIETIPEDIPPEYLVPYDDEDLALAAVETGEITAFYVVPADYVEEGTLLYVHPDASPLSTSGQVWMMRWVLLYNLVGGDTELAGRIFNPMDVQMAVLTSAEPSAELQEDVDSTARFAIPYVTAMVFYIVILMSASLLLRSVNDEKKNRVIEILMSSVTPLEMLAGKILGLGLVGLIQTVIWVCTGYVLLRLRGQTFSVPAGMELSPTIIVWGVVFFLLGYVVYASLMAGLGALVPNMREASLATIVIVSPMILVLVFISLLANDPHGSLATGLSLFPLTSPVAMMLRLAAGGVRFWHLLAAVALLIAAAVLIIRAVARMFHAQTLLSGQPFNVGRFFRVLLGRA